MEKRFIIKGCGRPFHQFIDRKYKKAIQDIIRSTERFLSRSKSYSNKCINLRMLKFLIRFYKKRLSYSVMNTEHVMLSMILPACNGTEFGKHPITAGMLKGIFRNCPALPRYIRLVNRNFLGEGSFLGIRAS